MAHDKDPHKSSALSNVLVGATGVSADPHDTDPPGAEPLSIKAGHEPDRFKAGNILFVPLLVVAFMLIAFAVVSVTFFAIVGKPPSDPNVNPAALAQSEKSINARFASISSTDPNAAVNQPRLEYLKQTAPDTPSDPAFYRSKRPIEAAGATWEIRPEDLRPENFVDPTYKRKILLEADWWGDDKKLAHIPIAEAMALVLSQNKLPTAKDAKPLPTTSDGKPKLSNAGRGGPSMPTAEPAPREQQAQTSPTPPVK